ncbi:hypothetical protein PIROE2DRAFT_5660 [Piromyces sp. E2]|nr:hypothetical protein PIROE2DRAFT_5660 [Piromyces sp. E2]|eukprot:OUM67048.1 hypothetical protein PIROE2DRAFT_5660 [Piromyces sp. E2]
MKRSYKGATESESNKKRLTTEEQSKSHAAVPIPHRILPSVFGILPLDDTINIVSKFLEGHLGTPNIEIEGKLGKIMDNNTKDRLWLPVQSETVLINQKGWRFVSDMTMVNKSLCYYDNYNYSAINEQHRNYNQILNKLVTDGNKPNAKSAFFSYRHIHQIDSFYQVPGHKEKLRLSTDKTNNNKNKVLDQSLIENIDAIYERQKDRLSYKSHALQIDLTQVQEPNNDKKIHELEIELDSKLLHREHLKLKDKQTHEQSQYYNILTLFMNSLRILSRSG